ncbi:MAG: hypothetical protein RL119_252 [Actinomycetota bacterium]
MEKANVDKKGHSTFKFLMSGTVDLDNAVVSATSNDGRNRATLTISHGCLGGESEGLTVVYLGERPFGSDAPYVALGSALNDTAANVSICETNTPTNCVTFASGTNPGTSSTLSLNVTSRLTLGYSAGQLTFAVLFNTSVTATQVFALLRGDADEPSPIAFSPDFETTIDEYSNTDTVYVVTAVCLGC